MLASHSCQKCAYEEEKLLGKVARRVLAIKVCLALLQCRKSCPQAHLPQCSRHICMRMLAIAAVQEGGEG